MARKKKYNIIILFENIISIRVFAPRILQPEAHWHAQSSTKSTLHEHEWVDVCTMMLYPKDKMTEPVCVLVSASRAHVLAALRRPPAGAQADLGCVW